MFNLDCVSHDTLLIIYLNLNSNAQQVNKGVAFYSTGLRKLKVVFRAF
jgi:hypothetical protein